MLGVPSTATDDEVKTAYRNLARKYHPDNYHDNPLADLAQERMKEINEAYEEIQTQRKRGASGGGYSTGASSAGYNPYGLSLIHICFAGAVRSGNTGGQLDGVGKGAIQARHQILYIDAVQRQLIDGIQGASLAHQGDGCLLYTSSRRGLSFRRVRPGQPPGSAG